MKLVSLVVPMYNEEEVINFFFEDVFHTLEKIKKQYKFEIVAVNDGSSDKTLELLYENQKRHPEVVVVNLSRNFGQEGALDAGLNVCTGDVIIPLDADLQDPPELIIDLLNKHEEGYDVVNAKMVSRRKDSFYKRSSAKTFYKFMNKNTEAEEIPEQVNNFRLITKRVKDEIVKLKEVNRVFRFEVPYVGFKTATIPYERERRRFGKTHFSNKMMLALAKESIYSETRIPAKTMWGIALGVFIVFGLSFITNIVFAVLSFSGLCAIDILVLLIWLLINVVILIGGLLCIGVAIKCEYQYRAYKEAQGRPNFIIESIKKGGKK